MRYECVYIIREHATQVRNYTSASKTTRAPKRLHKLHERKKRTYMSYKSSLKIATWYEHVLVTAAYTTWPKRVRYDDVLLSAGRKYKNVNSQFVLYERLDCTTWLDLRGRRDLTAGDVTRRAATWRDERRRDETNGDVTTGLDDVLNLTAVVYCDFVYAFIER